MKLSIIIPCYNCEKTLKEAVDSCFTQGLSDFEIIMVDDRSTDDTRSLMEQLSKAHKEIKLIFHEVNKGGGATRNTGIRASTGELIYCLDSDNFFAPNSLDMMSTYLQEKKADGVAFHERRFFRDNDSKKYTSSWNNLIDRTVKFEDLFNKNAVMLDNFLYTRASYDKTGGYPEHHGFDTQTFEICYVAHGLQVFIAPKSAFYHRQGQRGHKSYFEREYEKGLFSINTYLSIEPVIELLDDTIINLCVQFDVLNKNKFGTGQNLLDALRQHAEKGLPMLASDSSKKREKGPQSFVESVLAIRHGEYEKALDVIQICTYIYGSLTPLLSVNMIRARMGLKGISSKKIEVETAKELMATDVIQLRKMRWLPPFVLKIYSMYKTQLHMNSIKKIAGKVYRHGISICISVFSHRISKKVFNRVYTTNKELYLKKSLSYDYARYLLPQWQENTNEIIKYFENNFSFSFLNNQIIKRTMFMYTTKKMRDIQKKLIATEFGKDKAKTILKEYNVGRPLLNDMEYISSGNSIHHLYHIAKFFKETGAHSKNIKNIVEVGGGYGNMARLVKSLNPDCTYTIIDIPVFSYIQSTYLKTILGDSSVHHVDENGKVEPGKINIIPLSETFVPRLGTLFSSIDLFLSTWALSESNNETQVLYKNLDYFNAKYLLLAYQKSSETFAFAQKVSDIGADYTKIFEGETEYLKDNFYLIAERKNI